MPSLWGMEWKTVAISLFSCILLIKLQTENTENVNELSKKQRNG